MSDNEKVRVGSSGIHGIGVLAERRFQKGDALFVIKGSLRRLTIRCEADSRTGQNWIGIGKGVWIDPVSPALFLNHSCAPNAGIKGKLTVTALRNIEPGEEITIDYSITEIDPFWTMQCRCGAIACRELIRAIQHLQPQVFIGYIPYVPTFFAMAYFRKFNG